MGIYQISRRGLIEIAIRYSVSWFLLAAMAVVVFRRAGDAALEFSIFGLALIALLVYMTVQWFRAYRGKWQISITDTTVGLPWVGQVDTQSVKSVARFWRGPRQHCLLVRLRRPPGKRTRAVATVYPQYYERASELEAKLKELARQG